MRRRVMCQHQKHIQDLEPDRRNGEEIDRHHTLHVILKERSPGLGRRFPAAYHVFTYARFTDLDAEFEQFAVNPRSTPDRIFRGSLSESGRALPSAPKAAPFPSSNLPGPEEAKALALPADDRGGFHDEHPGLPI